MLRRESPGNVDFGWEEIEFHDHAGRLARSRWWCPPYMKDRSPPEFSIQIYTTKPLDESRAALVDFLERCHVETASLGLRYDLYAPLADLPACVDHQRLEIAYRQALDPQARLTHPIPKYFAAQRAGKGCDGFLIILTADTRRLEDQRSEFHYIDKPRWVPDQRGRAYHQDNPLWVFFQRATHTNVIDFSNMKDPKAKNKAQLEDDDRPEYFREMLEMYFYRYHTISSMATNLRQFRWDSTIGPHHFGHTYDYDIASTEEEHDPDPTYSKGVPDTSISNYILQENPINLSVTSIRPPGSSTDGVLVTNSKHGFCPHLRYLVYLNFQRPPGTELSTFGHLFASEVLKRLSPDNTTVHFEVYPTPSSPQQNNYSRLERILNDTRAQLEARHGFTIGGLQSNNSDRAFPVTRTAWDIRFPCEKWYTTFSVVLDTPNFVHKPGVLFALGDGGDTLCRDDTVRRGESISKIEIEVWRSTDMDAVAKRLRYENGLKYADKPSFLDFFQGRKSRDNELPE